MWPKLGVLMPGLVGVGLMTNGGKMPFIGGTSSLASALRSELKQFPIFDIYWEESTNQQ
jgi:hypothetical protein